MSKSAAIIATLALTSLVAAAAFAPARADLVLPRVSQNASVKQTVGITDLALTYSRPGVKGRVIWGALVPYGKPWRTGANEATRFTTSDDILVGGRKLSAGTYAFFTIPSSDLWTVIFSRQKDLWGSVGYDSTQDALRFPIQPQATSDSQEWMWLGFDDLTPSTCDLVLRWEKLRLVIPIVVEVTERVLASARAEIAAAKPDDWRTGYQAANWAFTDSVALGEAAGWLDRSLKVQENFQNLGLRARWLARDGKTADAIPVAERAIALGKAASDKPNVAPLEKQLSDWKASLPAAASKGRKK